MTDERPQLISRQEAAHVLWHYGPDVSGGRQAAMEPGSFVSTLIRAIALADPVNKARLYLGFPGYVAASALIENQPGGAARLVAVARGEELDWNHPNIVVDLIGTEPLRRSM